jgi:nanoRNase/pAp phosphatase (c-di-AMP/oligoRNAs hydrolase)
MKSAARNAATARKLPKLVEVLRRGRAMLIVLQDFPDPDAIAAGAALRKLANGLADVQCSIAHGGKIGRGENLALVGYLRPGLRPLAEVDVGAFDLVAMVDTQPTAGNNSLPQTAPVHIVIDHHRIRPATRRVPFTDIRRNYGATSTILCEYLCQAGVEVEAPLATALLYGIRSDTLDMGVGATQADGAAIESLYAAANKRMLSQIQRGKAAPGYFRLLARALRNARIYGDCVLCGLGEVDNSDMMGEVADLLLRHRQAVWTLCYGCYDNRLVLSLRTADAAKRADRIIRRIVGRRGSGGGHDARAGGQIPLREGTAAERRRLEGVIRKRMLRAVGAAERRGERLIEPDDRPKTGSS